jgi:hypothetical protein
MTAKRAQDILCRNVSSCGRSVLALIAWLDAGAVDFAWRHPGMHREQAPEVADILIADRPGDLGHVECGRQQQPLGPLHASGNHVLMRRKAHAGLETAREMEWAEVHDELDNLDRLF